MIKGLIEHEREVVVHEITFGKIPPIHKNNSGQWVCDKSGELLLELNLGLLMDQELANNSELIK